MISTVALTNTFPLLHLEEILFHPCFNAPGFIWNFITVDVLHICDLGITQMILGNLFFEFFSSPLAFGSNRTQKTQCLWDLIRDYYKRMKPPTQLNSLKPVMVVQSGKGPHLRAKGAETRHLVGFGYELASMMFENSGGANLRYGQLQSSLGNLMMFYNTFGTAPFDSKLASYAAKNFCILYSWFCNDSSDDKIWRMKPQFHIFLHLAEQQTQELGDPALFWAYQDEDFVGFVAGLAKSRGGKRGGGKSAENVISKYRGLSAKL